MLLQGAAVCGGGTTGTGGSWSEGQVATERQLLEACAPLVSMLQELLTAVYKVRSATRFGLSAAPISLATVHL